MFLRVIVECVKNHLSDNILLKNIIANMSANKLKLI